MKPKQRSLRGRIITLSGLLFVVFLGFLLLTNQLSMQQLMHKTEESFLEQHAAIVQGLINTSEASLRASTADIAFWEETTLFLQGENPAYFDTHWLDGNPFTSNNASFIIMKDAEGNDVYAKFTGEGRQEILDAPFGFSTHLNMLTSDCLSRYGEEGQTGLAAPSVSGIFFYNGVAYYICILPAIADENALVPAGTVSLGHVLDEAFFYDLAAPETLQISLVPVVDSAPQDGPVITHTKEHSSITVPMEDVFGNKIRLRIQAESFLADYQANIIAAMLVLTVVSLCFFMVLLYYLINQLILRPLDRLGEDLLHTDSSERINIDDYADSVEFTRLANSVNEMLQYVQETNISVDVFQRIFDNLDTHLYVSDIETNKILFINKKMMEDYNVSSSPIGRPCWQVFRAGLEGPCENCNNAFLRENPGQTVTWESYHPDTGRYYTNTDSLIAWADNRNAHLQSAMDITSIRNAEAALKRRLEQQELMSSVTQSFIAPGKLPVLIENALHMVGEFTAASAVLLFGYDPSAQSLFVEQAWHNQKNAQSALGSMKLPFGPGNAFYDMLVGEKRPYIACDNTTDETRYGGVLLPFGAAAFIVVPLHVEENFEGLLVFADDASNRTWDSSDIQLIRLLGSVISGVILRKGMEETLVRMSSIVGNSPNFITYTDFDGNILYFNEGVCAISGYAPEEIRGGNISLFVGEEAGKANLKRIHEAIFAEQSLSFEQPGFRKDGEQIVYSFSVFLIPAEEPALGVIGSNITKRVRLERDLIVAKEQAELSSRSKGDFLARMSHEMRTPMNAIIGMTGIAKATDDQQRQLYCLDKIDDASKHLLGVINDILDMSKIEANKFELVYEEFSFERMLQRITNIMNFRFDEKKQDLLVKIDPQVPAYLKSDQQRLSQVITNLLANATKFSPEASNIFLSIRLLEEVDGICTLQVDVKDEGIGIEKAQQARLFHSFEQADGGIARKYEGTGLGLAISKSIVEMMGGRIWVDSTPGEGSTFSFTVQVARGQQQAHSLLSPDINWRNLRILAVDDSPEVLEYFLSFAKMQGIGCETALGAQAALTLLEASGQSPFNIIFVDWRMPGMNGIDLTREIKTRYGSKIVVIMISAAEWDTIEKEAKQAGVDRFIPKPLFGSLIVNCINECLGGSARKKQEEAVKNYEGCFLTKRILLAEDLDINREIVEAMLEETGVTIDCAPNGARALEMFTSAPDAYDMIFMDIHMPEMDGFEATRRIRALDIPRAKDIPIVAMTANVFREDIEKCLAAGMDRHVGKPVDYDELMRCMVHYLLGNVQA